jgi:phage-related protein
LVEAVLAYTLRCIDEASSTMEKVQGAIGILGSSIGQLGGGFQSLGNVMTGFAAGGPVGAVISGTVEVAKGLQECVDAAGKSEQVYKDLAIAVEKSGTSWASVSEKTKEFALSVQSSTKYTDEAVAGMLQRMLTFGMSYTQAMDASRVAVDLAAAKHLDLETAATLVGKAFMGNTSILARYGIDVQSSKDASSALKLATDDLAGALKKAGSDALAPFADVLASAGVDIVDVKGKIKDVVGTAKDLIGAFQEGKINATDFGAIMGALGVHIDTTKLKAADFPAILAKMNEQFGGSAQAQAQTYAGIQERLKNATSELSEKIGSYLLPALTSVASAMIPVVDRLGQGVDAIAAWLTEVGKMPEVQGIMTAVGDAFKGFGDYLQGLWGFIQESFGPALRELLSAFKDLWDALSPIGDALKELLGIFGDTGNIDLLKTAIEFVVIQIRAVAFVIKEVSPYIKAFAQAFREAADFIAPILKEIVAGVRIFFEALSKIFQEFYDWLIGRSLWVDLWNQVFEIAEKMIVQLMGEMQMKFFSALTNTFTQMTQTIENLWKLTWQAILNTFNFVSSSVQSGLGVWFDSMRTNFGATMEQLKASWSSGWDAIQARLSNAVGTLEGILSAAISMMEGAWSAFTSFIQQGIGTVQGALTSTQAAVQSTFTTMQSTATPVLTQIQNAVSGTMNAIGSAATDLWNTLVGHSVWTEMLATMEDQTKDTMASIHQAFTSGVAAIPSAVAIAPTAPNASVGNVAQSIISQPTSITIPITVTLDSQVISKTVEKRMVTNWQLRERSIALTSRA